jgi:hypothetical protein
MKATIYGFLAVVVALLMLALPMKALARDHGGWHHDHGNHNGWYKHHGSWGGHGYYRGYWHHHDHDWYEHHGYGGYGYGYGGYPGYGGYGYGGYPGYGGYGGYPGNLICDEDGDDCRTAPLFSVPWQSGYYGPGAYYGQSYYGAPNAGKLMQLRQTMAQRLNANQALYQAAIAQGNYPLANKAATRVQYQSATINAANSMLSGVPVAGYPAYNQAAYGNPYYGQSGYSPLVPVLQMLGY